MRRRALGGFLAVLLALAACQSGEGAPSTTASPRPRPPPPGHDHDGDHRDHDHHDHHAPARAQRGGDRRRSGAAHPEPLRPGGDNWIVSRIGQAIFAGLTEVDGDTGAIIPDLAVALPTVANGGVVVESDGTTRVTFGIREEAVWENGTPDHRRRRGFHLRGPHGGGPRDAGPGSHSVRGHHRRGGRRQDGHPHLRRPHPGLRDDVPGDPPPAPDGGHRPRHRLEHGALAARPGRSASSPGTRASN